MAAPLVQRVTLDSAQAQRELAQLERQLLGLNQPINVPVDIDVDGTRRAETQMGQLRREVDRTGDEFTQLERKADQSTDGILRVGTRGASAFTSLRGSILGVGAALAAIQGVRLIGAFGADAIQAASSFNESLSKTNVVFGSLSDEIEKFAAKGPEALGLSTAAALEATSTFGNLFIALGLTQDAAAELSPGIVQLAADLASFNNIGVDEAVEKLRSGLVGEVEPLRSLGVSLNAATVDAKAFELGFVDANGAVTEAGKVQARYALILEQTSTAQGDYARTADGVANTQRSLAAAFEDAQRKLGEALLPAYQALLQLAPTLITALEDLAPVVADMSQSFADAVPAVAGFADAIQTLNAVGTVIGGLKEGSDVVRDFALGIGQIATGGIEQGVNQIGQGIDSIGTAIDNINVDTIRNTLVNALQAGVDPATALADRLAELSTIDLNPAQLQAEAQALTQIAGLDITGAVKAADIIRQQGQNAGLSTTQISALTRAMLGLFTAGSRGDADVFGVPEPSPDVVPNILSQVDALDQLSIAADASGVTISALMGDYDNLEPSLQRAVDALAGTSRTFLEQVDAINELQAATPELGSALDAAQDALRDKEGEIVGDLGTFFTQMRTELATQTQFDIDLSILRIRGQGALADVFAAEGIEANKLLTDAVNDPAAAGEQNAILTGRGKDSGDAYVEGLKAAFEGQPITQGMIDMVIAAANAAGIAPEAKAALLAFGESLIVEIPVPLVPDLPTFLDTLDAVDFAAIPVEPIPVPLIPALDAFLASLDLVDFAAIPVEAVNVPVEFGPGGRGGGGGGGPDTPTSPTRPTDNPFVVNFYTEPAPTTQTTRAAAIISGIVANNRVF